MNPLLPNERLYLKSSSKGVDSMGLGEREETTVGPDSGPLPGSYTIDKVFQSLLSCLAQVSSGMSTECYLVEEELKEKARWAGKGAEQAGDV